MESLPFIQFIEQIKVTGNLKELLYLLNTSSYQCLFVKNNQSKYLYANSNFIDLMGLNSLEQLRNSNDWELSRNAKDAKTYRDLDCCVLEEAKTLTVRETVMPQKNQPIIKTMEGKLLPLFTDDGRANYVLGVVEPESKLLRLDWDQVFQLPSDTLRKLLIKRSYKVQVASYTLSLSKMEILTLIELLKGQHAGEISAVLHVKQTTVESYLMNIKNKLGVSTKSELIHFITHNNLLQQIML